jgi:hypothetical protein
MTVGNEKQEEKEVSYLVRGPQLHDLGRRED